MQSSKSAARSSARASSGTDAVAPISIKKASKDAATTEHIGPFVRTSLFCVRAASQIVGNVEIDNVEPCSKVAQCSSHAEAAGNRWNCGESREE